MEKSKNQPTTLSSQTIVILWALIYAVGWMIIYLMIVNIPPSQEDLLILGFIGLLSGGIIGALQHTLIDQGTGIALKNWFILTAIGTSVGLMGLEFADELQVESPYFYLIPFFVVPAIFQWWSLRPHTQAGFLWIVGNTISGAIFVMFVLTLTDQGYELLSAMIPAGLQGIASGFVMVWLLRYAPKQALTNEKAKVEYDNKVKAS